MPGAFVVLPNGACGTTTLAACSGWCNGWTVIGDASSVLWFKVVDMVWLCGCGWWCGCVTCGMAKKRWSKKDVGFGRCRAFNQWLHASVGVGSHMTIVTQPPSYK